MPVDTEDSAYTCFPSLALAFQSEGQKVLSFDDRANDEVGRSCFTNLELRECECFMTFDVRSKSYIELLANLQHSSTILPDFRPVQHYRWCGQVL
jgi:hypothetical protein